MRVYVYTHRDPTPRIQVESVSLVTGVEPPAPSPSLLVPPSMTSSKICTCRRRCDRRQAQLRHHRARLGAYRQPAQRIQQAIRALTGVTVPILTDDAPEAAVPIRGNVILLGNRPPIA